MHRAGRLPQTQAGIVKAAERLGFALRTAEGGCPYVKITTRIRVAILRYTTLV
jgi:hypothetical protein